MVFSSSPKFSVSTWVASLVNLIKLFTSIVIFVYPYIFFFLKYLPSKVSNSSFVIQSFFLNTLVWSLKHCSVLSVPYRSFQVLCILHLITSYWFTLFVYRSSQKNSIHLTAVFNVFLHGCISLLLQLISISYHHLMIHMKTH